eukprot:TRINITY_DN13354_c0_g1_i1.p2 TRINITY_DN13354_c0_g1~~TRINITY_DN13354_c0_g1_i1.p2  ORF type:complete len:109 (-),score=27.77 TRINITY_DN13354_c0_g1_i1:80-406(-)
MQREAEEEAGCEVELKGILRVEYSPDKRCGCDRLRVIFLCAPKDITVGLKQLPDKESKGAEWASLQRVGSIARGEAEVEDCWLRGSEPADWFGSVSYTHLTLPTKRIV